MGCCCGKKTDITFVVQHQAQIAENKIDSRMIVKKYSNRVAEWVVQENEVEINKIIKEGFNPDAIFDAGGYDTTILILTIAFKKDNLTKIALLSKQNLDIIVRPNNDSALIMAISHRNIPIIQLLLEKGANRNILGPNDKSALQLADQQFVQFQKIEDKEGIQKINKIKQLLQNN